MLHRVSEGGHMVGRDIDAKRKIETPRAACERKLAAERVGGYIESKSG